MPSTFTTFNNGMQNILPLREHQYIQEAIQQVRDPIRDMQLFHVPPLSMSCFVFRHLYTTINYRHADPCTIEC